MTFFFPPDRHFFSQTILLPDLFLLRARDIILYYIILFRREEAKGRKEKEGERKNKGIKKVHHIQRYTQRHMHAASRLLTSNVSARAHRNTHGLGAKGVHFARKRDKGRIELTNNKAGASLPTVHSRSTLYRPFVDLLLSSAISTAVAAQSDHPDRSPSYPSSPFRVI